MKTRLSRKSVQRFPGNGVGLEALEPRRLFSAGGSVSADVLEMSSNPVVQGHASTTISFHDSTPLSTFLSASALQISGNSVSLTLTNSSSSTDATLKWIYLSYPQKNGSINRIDFGGSTIFNSSFPGPAVIIGSFQGTAADRTLAAGQSTTVTFFFSKKADAHAALYSMDLNFGATGGSVQVNI